MVRCLARRWIRSVGGERSRGLNARGSSPEEIVRLVESRLQGMVDLDEDRDDVTLGI